MNTLSGILNECGLVCPYDDELVCQLDDVCHKFVESVDLTESEFADWVKCYCKGDYSIKIRTFVEKMAHDNEFRTSGFPNCVWNALFKSVTSYARYRVRNGDALKRFAIVKSVISYARY